MPTDFERALSELLHTETPEPPDYLASPRAAATPGTSRTNSDAEVIELLPGTAHAPSRRRRWPTILAAAAVAALAAGVVTFTQLGNTDHGATHHPTGTGSPAPSNAAVPRCSDNQLILGSGPPLATQGHAGTAWFTFSNTYAKRCVLPPVSVAIGTGTTGGAAFPRDVERAPIPGHGKVVITAHVRVTGQCHRVKEGLRINVTQGASTGSWPLSLAGCTLTPLRLTHRSVG